MLSIRRIALSGMMAGLCVISAAPAFGQALAATATISSTPNGPNFDYTVVLQNTGTGDIGTFWFAWTPPPPVTVFEYDFLTSIPTNLSQPSGWTAPIISGFPGYSIEYYNVSGAGSDILPGQSGTFHFTSSNSPAQLQTASFAGFKNDTSYIYTGFPLSGATAQVVPTFVPEPATWMLMGMGAVLGFVVRRRQKIRGC